MANGSIVEVDRRAVRQQDALLRQVDRQLGVRIVVEEVATGARGSSGETTIGSSPFLRLLLRKMSAKLVERIARMPQAVSAHGACSRDEPAPKLSPTSRICAAGHPRLVEDERRVLERAVLLEPPVAEERLGEAGLVGHLEVARRDDLVGVDVLGVGAGRPCS